MNSLTMLRPSRTLTILIALGLAAPCRRGAAQPARDAAPRVRRASVRPTERLDATPWQSATVRSTPAGGA